MSEPNSACFITMNLCSQLSGIVVAKSHDTSLSLSLSLILSLSLSLSVCVCVCVCVSLRYHNKVVTLFYLYLILCAHVLI
jgi:hypothetical protein